MPLRTRQIEVGKTIGVPSVNGISDKTVSMSLRKAGIDPESVNHQLVGFRRIRAMSS